MADALTMEEDVILTCFREAQTSHGRKTNQATFFAAQVIQSLRWLNYVNRLTIGGGGSVRLLRIVLVAGGLVSSERGRKIPQPVDRGGNNKMQMHRRDHMGRKKSVGQMERHCHVCRKR
jgi:hypothetical protein